MRKLRLTVVVSRIKYCRPHVINSKDMHIAVYLQLGEKSITDEYKSQTRCKFLESIREFKRSGQIQGLDQINSGLILENCRRSAENTNQTPVQEVILFKITLI